KNTASVFFEIDLSNSLTNESSIYAVSNKRAKLDLDSALLWHCRLGHISKKRIEKLQHHGLLDSSDLTAFEKCVSCMSGKMARKPYTYQVERAKDLLGLIHTDVCSPFKIMSRQGASYFVTFTNDFSRYSYVYLLKHKHKVFETFKVFQKEVENQLGKTIKSLSSDRGGDIPMLQSVKTYHGKCFAMKDLGEAAYILGIKIYRDRSKRLNGLCQSAYIEKILKQFCMENSKRGSIPMQEKLKLSKSQGASTPAEMKRMQNVPYALAVGSIMVSCYTDAGYLTDADDLKSQTRYVFVLNGGAVDLKSAKQSIFATSYVEAEYIAAFDASKEAVWVRKFISRLGVVPTIKEPISMYCDNTGAIAIANESGITKGARYFRAKVHYLREVIEFGDIKLEKFHTDENLADPFTKALAFPKHSEHTTNIGMLPASSLM
nr:hypothetical protein [Tanacetum cinerariifolium]